MKDLTSQEIIEAIDRAMKKVAAKFAAEPEQPSSQQKRQAELAEEPKPFVAHRD